jgi:hypothetical protein
LARGAPTLRAFRFQITRLLQNCGQLRFATLGKNLSVPIPNLIEVCHRK